jgi:predicted RNase H-like HicB family nuclease
LYEVDSPRNFKQYSKTSWIKGRKTEMKYLIIIEKAKNNYSAYIPDVPGCIATGKTPDEAHKKIAKALKMQLSGLKEAGLPIPEPLAQADYIAL